MLKPASYAAQRFLGYAQVGSNMAQGHPLQYMRRLLQQVFIPLCSGLEMCIYKPLFQADIIFFVSYP